MVEVAGWLDEFFWGTLVIIQVFLLALVLTVLWGLLGAAAKLSGRRVAMAIATAYTTVFRGTPELLVLLIIYYGSAVTLTGLVQIFDPSVQFIDIPPFMAGSFAISLIVGAYATETFRGAFLGVEHGQIEAARSLGLRPLQIFFLVRFPQMWRIALPTFGNHMISLTKDTALISVVGLQEIMFVADMATSVTSEPFTMYLVVALIYLLLTSTIAQAVAWLELRANRHLVRTP